MTLGPQIGRISTFGIVAFGTAMLGWIVRYDTIPVPTFALALAVFLLTLLPLFDWLRRGARTMPMFELIALSYGVHMGLGAITQPNAIVIYSQIYELEWKHINEALVLSLVGIAVLLVTFFGASAIWKRAIPVSASLPVAPHRRKQLLLLLLGITMASRLLERVGVSPPGGLGTLLNIQLFVAAVLAAVFYYRLGDRSRFMRLFLVASTFLLTVEGLTSGMLERAVVPVLSVFVVRTACLRRIPVGLVTAVCALLLVLNLVKYEYRERVWNAGEGGNTAEKISLWMKASSSVDFLGFFSASRNREGLKGWRESLARFSLVDRFAWVCANTPERVHFFHGESYKPFVYAPVPRVVWPEKPVASDALELLDFSYDLKQAGGGQSIGIGYLAEAYANFSWYGIVAVMAIQALVLSLFDWLLNRPWSQAGAALFVMLLASMLNGIGASAIIIYGNLLQMLVGCALVIGPFSTKLWVRDHVSSQVPARSSGTRREQRKRGPSVVSR